jgi:DNA-binding response OmpR family regulator
MSGDSTLCLQVGNVTIDKEERQVYCCGQPIELTCLQFNLLIYLFDHANRVCFYDELLEYVWHYDSDASDSYIVRMAISRLRHSFQNCPNCQGQSLHIRTIRQVGYCLQIRKSPSASNR